MGVFVSTLLFLMTLSDMDNKTIVDTNFGEFEKYNNISDGQISGQLPIGWMDNSSWAKLNVNYMPIESDGLKFMRVHVRELSEGWCQLAYQPLNIQGGYYQFSVKVRNLSRATIHFAIRTTDPPYEFVWEENGTFSRNWEEYDFRFHINTPERPVMLLIAIVGEGMVDIAKLSLIEQSREYIIEEAKNKSLESKNLLRVSRFPLGLQSGWSLDRDCSDNDDVIINTDSNVKGISGADALKIESSRIMKLYLTTFNINKIAEPHVASLYIKGKAKGKLKIISDRDIISQTDFNIENEDEWQICFVKFDPRLIAKVYSIMLEGSGKFWIDALQIEPGTEPTKYKNSCEIALSCPYSDTSNINVQFDDEPSIVQYCVSGSDKEFTAKFKVVNLYGDEKIIEHKYSNPEKFNYGKLQYDVFSEKPYGAFRIEAWVEDSNNVRISPYNELIVHRIRRPRYWMKDAPNSHFGIHTNSTTRHILMSKAIGINWTRLHDAGGEYLMWYFLEPQRGEWQFRDKEIHRYRKYGMKILGELGTAPKWASYYQDVGKDHSGYFDTFYQPKNLDDYAVYVRTVTERYKGVIDAYDVWNEPWIHAWWAVGYDENKKSEHGGYVTSEKPMVDFVNLMKTAYINAKSIDSNITILGVNTTSSLRGEGNFSGDEWTTGIIENGGLNYCDVICYHNYIFRLTGFPDDDVSKGYKIAMGSIIEKNEKAKPIWMTEGSPIMLKTGSGFYKHTIPYKSTENVIDTADSLCRYIVSLLSNGVDKIFLYSMHCHSYFPQTERVRYNMLVTDEGSLHPGADAFSAMAWLLEDSQFFKVLNITQGCYAYLFKSPERSIAVLSTEIEHAEINLPAKEGIHVWDLFGNCVNPGSRLSDTLVYIWAPIDVQELENLLNSYF